MAMDALFLAPGSSANVWLTNRTGTTAVSVESSNPAVLGVPGSVATPNGTRPVSFVARAVSAGQATIRLSTPAGTLATLTVDVVAAGTKPRFPVAFVGFSNVPPAPAGAHVSFDRPLTFVTRPTGTAPFTGEIATGLVTIQSNGRELARTTLTPGNGPRPVSVYLPDVGPQSVTLSYTGDTNFLPLSARVDVVAVPGATTIIASAERSGPNATIHVRVTGSPAATPTGTIIIPVAGMMPPPQARLVEIVSGVAEADVALSNVGSAPFTLLVAYSGDSHYNPQDQNVRLSEGRKRVGKH
jgi:hypothetical protein